MKKTNMKKINEYEKKFFKLKSTVTGFSEC